MAETFQQYRSRRRRERNIAELDCTEREYAQLRGRRVRQSTSHYDELDDFYHPGHPSNYGDK